MSSENRGYFEPEGVEGVLLFFGMTPDDATICRYELAYTITLNNLGCLPDQPAPDLAKWLEPVNRPFPLRNKPPGGAHGGRRGRLSGSHREKDQGGADSPP